MDKNKDIDDFIFKLGDALYFRHEETTHDEYVSGSIINTSLILGEMYYLEKTHGSYSNVYDDNNIINHRYNIYIWLIFKFMENMHMVLYFICINKILLELEYQEDLKI
jgi:hypothetical protein